MLMVLLQETVDRNEDGLLNTIFTSLIHMMIVFKIDRMQEECYHHLSILLIHCTVHINTVFL